MLEFAQAVFLALAFLAAVHYAAEARRHAEAAQRQVAATQAQTDAIVASNAGVWITHSVRTVRYYKDVERFSCDWVKVPDDWLVVQITNASEKMAYNITDCAHWLRDKADNRSYEGTADKVQMSMSASSLLADEQKQGIAWHVWELSPKPSEVRLLHFPPPPECDKHSQPVIGLTWFGPIYYKSTMCCQLTQKDEHTWEIAWLMDTPLTGRQEYWPHYHDEPLPPARPAPQQ